MSTRITTRKDGRKQMTYYAPLINGGKKRQYVYGKTREEVIEKYSQAIRNVLAGHAVLKNEITLAHYLIECIKNDPDLRESTKINYCGEVNKYIAPRIGKTRLSNLKPIMVRNMLDALLREGVSLRTVHILKNILSKTLRQAEMSNLVSADIMRSIKLKEYRPKPRLVWGIDDVKVFSGAIKNNKYYFFFLMYITYGLRRGEAIAIKWEDIDFKNSIIHIRRQYTLVGGEPTICSLKTYSSTRDLPLLPHIEHLLREMENQKTGEYVLTCDGKPINPVSVNYEFDRIINDCGLPKVTLHSLRHFAATALKDAGVTIKEAQEILGHSDPTTTIRYYQHSSMEDKRIALSKYAENMSF